MSGFPCSLRPAQPAARACQQSHPDSLPHCQGDPSVASQHRPRPPGPALLAGTTALPVQVGGPGLVGLEAHSLRPEGRGRHSPPGVLGLQFVDGEQAISCLAVSAPAVRLAGLTTHSLPCGQQAASWQGWSRSSRHAGQEGHTRTSLRENLVREAVPARVLCSSSRAGREAAAPP